MVLTYEVALTVTVSAWSSVKAIDMQLIRAGRLFGADGVFMIWRVLIPAALPAIISGYRIAFSRAWRLLIIAEMLVSVTAGLGYRLYFAREFFQLCRSCRRRHHRAPDRTRGAADAGAPDRGALGAHPGFAVMGELRTDRLGRASRSPLRGERRVRGIRSCRM